MTAPGERTPPSRVPWHFCGNDRSWTRSVVQVSPQRPRRLWRGVFAFPILAAALVVGWQVRRLRRLARLRRGVVGTLLREAPGTITLRRSDGSELTVHLEGGEVLRASELALAPAGLRRGLALDLLENSPVTALGGEEGGGVYRGDPSRLRLRPGDLALVGCTLAEARRRVGWRLTAALLFLSSVQGSLVVADVLSGR